MHLILITKGVLSKEFYSRYLRSFVIQTLKSNPYSRASINDVRKGGGHERWTQINKNHLKEFGHRGKGGQKMPKKFEHYYLIPPGQVHSPTISASMNLEQP